MSRAPESVHILLVNPWIIDFKAFDLWMKPMGLLYISSVLRANGFQVHLADCMDRNHPSVRSYKKLREDGTGKFHSVEIDKPEMYRDVPRKYKRYGIPVDAFVDDIRRLPRIDVILVTSMMTYWYPGVHEAIRVLRRELPGVPIILGGVYATLCNGFASCYSGADIVFAGGDLAYLLGRIGNLTYVRSEFIPKDFLQYPFPDYSGYGELDYCCVLTSLGCPFACSYCASRTLQPGFTQRSPASVVSEIVHQAEFSGVSSFAFYDDALLANRDWHIVPLLEKIIELDQGFTFHTPNGLHARFIDLNTAQLMKEAGFSTIRISLETADPDMLMSTGNKVKVSETQAAVMNLLEAGFPREDLALYIMMGIPGQTFREIEKTIDFVYSLGIQSRLSMFSPIPGTEAYELMRSGSMRLPDDPLSQNNTYQYYLGESLDFSRRSYLMDKAFQLNREILERLEREREMSEESLPGSGEVTISDSSVHGGDSLDGGTVMKPSVEDRVGPQFFY